MDPLTKIFILITAFLFFAVSATRIKSIVFFYCYLASLFYADYLKLMIPPLPIGFIPDSILFMFLIRVFFFERRRLIDAGFKKNMGIFGFLIIGYFLFNFAEIFNSSSPSVLLGFQSFRAIFKIMIIYWGTLLVIDSPKSAFSLIRFLAGNILIVFLFSFKQILFGFSDFEMVVYSPGTIRRIYSTLTNAAVFSVVLGIGAIHQYLEALYKEKFMPMLVCFIYLLVSLTTLHRAPFFATLFALFLLTAVNYRVYLSFLAKNLNYILLMICIVGLSLSFIFFGPVPGRMAQVRDEAAGRIYEMKKGKDESSLKVRLDQMDSVFREVGKYPFGAGLGYTHLRFGNSFESASFFKGVQNMSYQTILPMGTGDSSFLTILIETGWVGAIYFVLLISGIWIATLVRSASARLPGDSRQLLSFSLGVMTVVILSIVTSSIYFTVIVGSLFWISYAITQIVRRQRAEP